MKIRPQFSLVIAALLLTSLFLLPAVSPVMGQKAVKRFRYIQPIPKPPAHFNVFVSGSAAVPSLAPLVVEPLAFLNRDNGTWFPWLATDWNLSKDGKTLTVHLRRGVKWSDGTTFTSKDVLTTWYCGYIMKWWQWRYIDRIEAPDDYTVVFHLKQPWIYAEFYLMRSSVAAPYSVYGNFSDAAQAAIKAGDTARLGELLTKLTAYRPPKPVGTGPFEFVALSESQWLFRKRTEYWHGIDLIKFDEYMQIHLGTGPSEFAGILSKAGDLCSPDLTREIYEELKQRPDIYVPIYSWRHGQSLLFNGNKYPLSLVEVRQAIAYAINRTELCIAVSPHPDLAMPIEYPTGMLVGDELRFIRKDYLEKYFNKYEYNTSKTIEIFQSLGFTRGADGIWVTPNGTRLEFDILSAPWTDWALACENTKLQLAKVGIKINVYATEPVVCVRVPAGDFDLAYYCVLRRWLPLPTETFDVAFAQSWAAGMGTLNKVYEVPEYGMVNATEWASRLPTVLDEKERSRMIEALAYIANHYLPHLAIREKPCTYTYNIEDIIFPPKGDTFYAWASAELETATAFYILNGLIRPVITPTAYVTAYAIKDVSAFIGVDGKTYGPYKSRDAALLPKEDADRLITEGKFSLTPPTPEIPELLQTVAKLKQDVASVQDDVKALSGAVSKLGDSIGGIQSIGYASIGISLVALVLAIVSLLRKKS
jgi:peptide/nickel transport system substrate-binding protein